MHNKLEVITFIIGYYKMMNMPSILNKEELEQIVNILKVAVIGRTISALEMLINEPIECENIRATNLSFNNLDGYMLDSHVCSVYINGKGDLNLAMLMVLSIEEAKWIASKMIGMEVQEIDELSKSAISELGNILLIGSFINALANITDFRIECSVPGFAIEDHRSIIEYILAENCNDSNIVATTTTLLCKDTQTRLHITLLLNPDDAKKIIS